MKATVLRKLSIKYRQGKASAAERYVIDTWYDSFERDDSGWPDGDKLNMIQNRIIERALQKPKVINWYRSPLMRVAASILLVVSATLGIYLLRMPGKKDSAGYALASFQTGTGQIKRILLTDSTVVMLNANSTLSLLPDYGARQRRVSLTGEAFFKVHKDKAKAFIVHTSALDVKVLGTSFDVQAYDKLKHIKVSVTTGKVGVSAGQKQLALLTRGQQVVFNKYNGEPLTSAVNPEAGQLWTSGTIVLERAGFDELAQHFLNLYGIRLSSTNATVRNNKYNLTVRSTRTWQQTLEQLSAMTGRKYRKEADGRIIIY